MQPIQINANWVFALNCLKIKFKHQKNVTPGGFNRRLSVVFTVNFEQISQLVLMLLWLNAEWDYPSLRQKCPYSELFWSVFSRIRAEYGEILRIFPYSGQMQENADQNNSEYGHFLRSAYLLYDKYSVWKLLTLQEFVHMT